MAGPIPPYDPSNAETCPWPCRGVYVKKGATEHLYLLHYSGAGASATQYHSLYHVDLTAGTWETPIDTFNQWAFRGLAATADGSKLIAVDMSWSKDNQDQGPMHDRLVPIPLLADGKVGTVTSASAVDTGLTSDDKCESTIHWPTDATMATLGGQERLLVGHDLGVATFDPATLQKVDDLNLKTFGRLFNQISLAPKSSAIYAMPQCKAFNQNHDWTLPYGAATERADKNLVAVLADVSGKLSVGSTTIDVNRDGTLDHGIDLDYYGIKSYIRTFNTTMPIPPVVYTGPRLAIGQSMIFARGTGIQGNGAGTISSSGLGQVQDLGFLDLQTGNGLVFNRYMPFFDGLNSEAGTGNAIWGYDVWPGRESSVGFVHYIAAP